MTKASFNLFNGHLGFLFCKISFLPISLLGAYLFLMDLQAVFPGCSIAVISHCGHAFDSVVVI